MPTLSVEYNHRHSFIASWPLEVNSRLLTTHGKDRELLQPVRLLLRRKDGICDQEQALFLLGPSQQQPKKLSDNVTSNFESPYLIESPSSTLV